MNNPSNDFFQNVHKECSILANALYIVEKLNTDSLFDKLKDTCSGIFSAEFGFILAQVSRSGTDINNPEARTKIKGNMYVFKENFKLISNIIGRLISGGAVEKQD